MIPMTDQKFSPAVAEGTGLLGSDTVLLVEQFETLQSVFIRGRPKRIAVSKSRIYYSGTVENG
jgi:hypothetical protein